ncbi:MAG: hypothetical protein M5U12_27580 [Verrucomicrobia bacterium]|nr:hypothetical protein [Verrucomicrobiota bacterium]
MCTGTVLLVFTVGWLSFGPRMQAQGALALGQISGGQLKEISGLAASRQHPGLLWVHNDGTDGRLFAVRTNGQLAAVFRLPCPVEDLEDIARGPGGPAGTDFLYVGDIGDNAEERATVRVHRVPEPAPRPGTSPRQPATLTGVETLTLRYPDGPHDAEALLCDPWTGELLIVTKQKKRARVYRAPADAWTSPGVVRLSFLCEVPFAQVSAGDISPDGRRLLLRREGAAVMWTRAAGEPLATALAEAPLPAAVIGPPSEPNGEAIAWAPDNQGYYTLSEGKRQPIYFFSAPPEGAAARAASR